MSRYRQSWWQTITRPAGAGSERVVIEQGGEMAFLKRVPRGAGVVLVGTLVLSTGAAYASTRAPGSSRHPSSPPTTPTNLKVTATTDDSVSLSWGVSTDGNTSFTYYINVSSSTNPDLDEYIRDITTTSYTLSAQPVTTYSFIVFALNSSGQPSENSNSVTTTTPPAPPTPAPGVSVTGTTPWTINLAVTYDSDGYYLLTINGPLNPNYPGPNEDPPYSSSTVTLVGLEPSSTYGITATAYNEEGVAGDSTTISATTDVGTDTTNPSPPSNFTVPDYEEALGYSCTEQEQGFTWTESSDPNFPQAELYYEVIINGKDTGPEAQPNGEDIFGSEENISNGTVTGAAPVYVPEGTDTIEVVAVNPAGLVSAPSNSFTGNFTPDC
jgi:hypothetical protein